MQATAFQVRQCESAIWLHQIGIDNKPPEYKGSFFFLFPNAACQSCWLIPSKLSLSLSYVFPSCALQLSWHMTTGLIYKMPCIQCYRKTPGLIPCVHMHTPTSFWVIIFHSKVSVFAPDWYSWTHWLYDEGTPTKNWSRTDWPAGFTKGLIQYWISSIFIYLLKEPKKLCRIAIILMITL